MRQITKLESGKTYTLSQIFSDSFIIAIPDLQRDYCWGLETFDKRGKQQGELVSGFLSSLKSKWEETSDRKDFTPMGLIYGYEWPKGTYQLCDGQQRITTFYLLAGELYRNELVSTEMKEVLRHILFKHSAGSDSVEMMSALQYSIRETTLYFLSDLVEHYFQSPKSHLAFYNTKEREKTHTVLNHVGRPFWYFMEYDNDPTIQSMLGAISTISHFLKESFNESKAISSFANAIANQFSFIYYDMGNRMRGEETFVVINTTGEPLTSTENLKPLLLAGLHLKEPDEKFVSEISRQWEEREDWFWQHKSGKELTSDELSRDFYMWWMMINDSKEKVNLIKDYTSLADPEKSILKIHSLYQSLESVVMWIKISSECQLILKKLAEWTEDSKIDFTSESTVLSWLRTSSHREIFLPLLAFHNKFGEEILLTMLRRLAKNYYIGKTTHGDEDTALKRPYAKFVEIINLIKNSSSVSEVLNDPVWHNHDEERKESIFKDHPDDLIKFEVDDNLRFDLNILWDSGASSIEDAKLVRKRMQELHQLSEGRVIEGYDEAIANSMSNQYRLIRFFKKWGHPNGKQYNVNWKQWGTWFTWDRYSDNLARSYKDQDMWSLLSTKDLSSSLDSLLKILVREIHLSEGIFSEKGLSHPEGMMRAWLIAKLLVNEYSPTGKKLISTYGNYSLCVNKDEPNENKLNRHLPVSIGNMCLHFVTRTGPWKVGAQFYSETACLDTPLYIGLCDVSHKDFINGKVSEEVVDETTAYILDLFNNYFF